VVLIWDPALWVVGVYAETCTHAHTICPDRRRLVTPNKSDIANVASIDSITAPTIRRLDVEVRALLPLNPLIRCQVFKQQLLGPPPGIPPSQFMGLPTIPGNQFSPGSLSLLLGRKRWPGNERLIAVIRS
jgi:hypothetical protein